jgi:hypothetical protein
MCACWATPSSTLSRRPRSAGCGTCTCSCSGPTAWSGPSLWEIYPTFSSRHSCKQCTVIVPFRPYVQVWRSILLCSQAHIHSWALDRCLPTYMCFSSRFHPLFLFLLTCPVWLSSFLSWSLCFLQANHWYCKLRLEARHLFSLLFCMVAKKSPLL